MSLLHQHRPPHPASGVFIALSVLTLSVLLGLITAVFPWYYTVILVVAPAAFLLSAGAPWLGLVFALALLFEIIPKAFVPQLPLVGGRLQGYDVLLLYLAALYALRLALAGRLDAWREVGPFRWALLYLAVAGAVSLVYARFVVGNEFALAEARVHIAWLVLPLALAFFGGAAGVKRMSTAVLVFGCIVALYASVQSLFDLRIMTDARVESLDVANADVTRSIAGGGVYLIVFALFVFLNRLAERPRHFWWLLPAIALTLLGLAVQFGRGVWVATAAGLLLSAFMHRGWVGAGRVLLIGGLALAALVAGLSVVRPRMVDALEERAMGIVPELRAGGSFHWRVVENNEALQRIAEKPLTGVGIGGDYKRTISSSGSFAVETRYIHNAYLYFPLKMGVLASLIPLAFIIAFGLTVRRILHQRPDVDRGLLAALCGAFLVPVLTSGTQPEWVSPRGIAALALFMAMALMLLRSPQGPARPAAGPA
jgi:hypothetical protein